MPHGETYYTAFSVLQSYLTENGYAIQNFSLQEQAPDRVEIWVESNPQNVVNFVCVKMSCSQFLIWGYAADSAQIISTGFNYAVPTL